MLDIGKTNGDGGSSDLPLPLKMIIYKVTNLINNKVYIGKTQNGLNERKKRHLSDARANKYNMVFHKALRKYNVDDFVWEILDTVMFSDLLTDLEKFYIKKYNSKIPNGYNMTDGSGGGWGEGRIQWNKGKKNCYTKEHLLKISERMSGEKHWGYGKQRSEETKQKIRESINKYNRNKLAVTVERI